MAYGKLLDRERMRVINHVKATVVGKSMKQIFPQHPGPNTPGHQVRYWKVTFTDLSFQWYLVDYRVVTPVGPPPL